MEQPISHLNVALSHLSGGELKERPSLPEISREFEAYFVAHLLKVMRESSLGEEDSQAMPGKAIQMEMMEQEVARHLVRSQGLGIAEQIQAFLEDG